MCGVGCLVEGCTEDMGGVWETTPHSLARAGQPASPSAGGNWGTMPASLPGDEVSSKTERTVPLWGQCPEPQGQGPVPEGAWPLLPDLRFFSRKAGNADLCLSPDSRRWQFIHVVAKAFSRATSMGRIWSHEGDPGPWPATPRLPGAFTPTGV